MKAVHFYFIAVGQKCDQAPLVGPEHGCVVRCQAFQNLRVGVMELIHVAIRYECELRIELIEECF